MAREEPERSLMGVCCSAGQLSQGRDVSKRVRGSLGLFLSSSGPRNPEETTRTFPRDRHGGGGWHRVFSFEPSIKPAADTAGLLLDQWDAALGLPVPPTCCPGFLNFSLPEVIALFLRAFHGILRMLPKGLITFLLLSLCPWPPL